MTKTSLILIALVLAAAGVLYALRTADTEQDAALYPERDFAVGDASAIARIFIADLEGRTANFTRTPAGGWRINDAYDASPAIMREVVNALSKLRIDHVPPAGVTRVVLDDIKSKAIKVASFDANGQPLKSIIIGPPTQDERYSYVLVEGYNEPFAVRIPGITGSIASLFDITNIDEFRSKELLALEPAELRYVRVDYPRDPGESFVVERGVTEGSPLSLKPASDVVQVLPKGPSERRLESYLEQFAYLPLSRRAEQIPGKDSIRRLVPFAGFTLVQGVGDTTRLRAWPWHIRDAYGKIDPDAQIANYWVDRDGEAFVVVSSQQLKPWLRGYTSFERQ